MDFKRIILAGAFLSGCAPEASAAPAEPAEMADYKQFRQELRNQACAAPVHVPNPTSLPFKIKAAEGHAAGCDYYIQAEKNIDFFYATLSFYDEEQLIDTSSIFLVQMTAGEEKKVTFLIDKNYLSTTRVVMRVKDNK